MKLYWPSAKWKIEKNFFFKESKLLHLNSSKAKKELKWHCFLNLDETIKFTISWYKTFIEKNENIYNFSVSQIKDYLKIVKK